MTDDDAEVMAAAAKIVAAFAAHDRSTYFECFAPNATFVFYTTPMLIRSRAASEELWDRWEHEDDFRVLSCESRDQHVTALDKTAVFTHRVATTARVGDEIIESDEQETIVFQRRGDRWLAVHEHLWPMPSDEST